MYKIFKIKNDTFEEYISRPLVSGDVGTYKIVLATDYDLKNCSVRITAKRADGVILSDVGTVNGHNAEYVIKSSVYAVEGDVEIRLVIVDKDGNGLTDKALIFNVIANHASGDMQMATNDGHSVADLSLAHIYNYKNPHRVTKSDVGLGNADNTSDLDKPLSNAAKSAFGNVVSMRPNVISWGIKTVIDFNTPINECFWFWTDGFEGIDTIVSDGIEYLTQTESGASRGLTKDKLYLLKLVGNGWDNGKCVILYEGDKDEFYMSLVKSHTHENKDILDSISGVDTAPTSGSGNLVTSGGVYDAIKNSGGSIGNIKQVFDGSEVEDAPVGHIISIMSNTAPSHYLVCDGTEYNIADYPYLSQHFIDEFGRANYFGGDGTTTFKVPDLRGEFLRGVGTATRNTGSGAAKAGVHQDGTISMAVATVDNVLQTRTVNNTTGWSVPKNMDKRIETSDDVLIYATTSKTNYTTPSTSDAWTGYTSRPTNTSVLYCIKYEPTYFMVNNNSYNGDVIGTGGLKVADNKVDVDFDKVQAKEQGKGLSQNDYTNSDKALVSKIPEKLDNMPASGDEYDTGKIWLDGSTIYRKDFCFEITGLTPNVLNEIYLPDIFDGYTHSDMYIVDCNLICQEGYDVSNLYYDNGYMFAVTPIGNISVISGFFEYVKGDYAAKEDSIITQTFAKV